LIKIHRTVVIVAASHQVVSPCFCYVYFFPITVIVGLWFLILLCGPLCVVTLSVSPVSLSVLPWRASYRKPRPAPTDVIRLTSGWRHWSDLGVTSWTVHRVTSSADVTHWPFPCTVVPQSTAVLTDHKHRHSSEASYLVSYFVYLASLTVDPIIRWRRGLSGLVCKKPILVCLPGMRRMMSRPRRDVQNNVSRRSVETFQSQRRRFARSTRILGKDPTTFEAYRVHPIGAPDWVFGNVLEMPIYALLQLCLRICKQVLKL